MKKIILLFTLISASVNYGQNTSGYNLLVNYPFTSNLSDTSGNYNDADATNAPFQGGGIYLNGIYNNGNNGNYSQLFTDQISSFDMNKFIVKVDFKLDNSANDQILICGKYFRWLTAYTSNNKLELLAYSSSSGNTIVTNQTITSNTWYTLGIEYNHDANQIKIYLDNNLVNTTDLPAGFTFFYNDDFIFTPEDGGIASIMKGYWRNFYIYANATTGIDDIYSDKQVSLYPNPSNGMINIDTEIPEPIKSIQVFDSVGKQIGSFFSDGKIKLLNPNRGIYFVKVNFAETAIVKKVIITG